MRPETLNDLADRCHARFYMPVDFATFKKRLASLADALQTTERLALLALFELDLGLVRGRADPAGLSWVEEPEGEVFLTLPHVNEGVLIDLLALDVKDPARVFYHDGGGPDVLGAPALFDAQAGGYITLFETPLHWLRGWCGCFAPIIDQELDRSMDGPHFPGVCLLDPEAPLLPNLTGIARVTTPDLDFGKSIVDRLMAEISAPSQRPRYPQIIATLPEKETV